MSATATNSITGTIREALDVLHEPGEVVELRILKTRKNTVAGYFADLDKLARATASYDAKAPALYTTLNPCDPALLSRAVNRLVEYAEDLTTDRDILRRRWFPIDLDAVRPKGIASTDTQHDAALDRAREVRAWLTEQGWSLPVLADSGNGGHLLYRLDLPNDEASRNLLARSLAALALRFSDQAVCVDETVFNAARIWKLYGTFACKGDHTPERPHRRSALLEVPDTLEVVSGDLLAKLAALAPVQPDPTSRPSGDRFDVEAWVTAHNLPVVQRGPWSGGRKWILNPCPWNPEHNNRAAYIVQHASGAIAAGCQHNGCHGKDWHALRDLVEPGWRDMGQSKTRSSKRQETSPASAAEILSRADTRPSIRPGQDLANERLIYGVSVGNEALFVTSKREAWTGTEAGRLFRLPKFGQLPRAFRPEAIERHLRGESVSLGEVVIRAQTIFRDHLFWRSREIPSVLALWVAGTYVFTVFRFYGYLWLTSPERRCGKSTVLDLLALLCFHATARTINPSGAVLYRDVGDLCKTAILDEIEDLRGKDREAYGDLIRLLNGGFQSGTVIPRMEKVGDSFQVREYHAYSPKALAGISRLPDTIEDRAFKITMWPKRKADGVRRLNLRRQAGELADLRDDLYRAGLAYAGEIVTFYDKVDELDIPDGLDDRARDIFESLFALAALVDADREDRSLTMTNTLRAFALEQAGIRASDERQGPTGLVARALGTLPIPGAESYILTPDEAVTLLQRAGLDWVDTKKKAGTVLSSLGLHSKTHRVGGEPVRGYRLDRALVDDLAARFADEPIMGATHSVTSATGTDDKGLGPQLVLLQEASVTDRKSGEAPLFPRP